MSYSFSCSLSASEYEEDYVLDNNSQNDFDFRIKGHIQFPSKLALFPSWVKDTIIHSDIKAVQY